MSIVSKDFLEDIVKYKKSVLQKKKGYFDRLKTKIKDVKQSGYHTFLDSISNGDDINLIAEVKKASPSKGMIRDDFEPIVLGKLYEECKAKAISVITEDKYFLGKIQYLRRIADVVHVPVLQKDFFIDENQIYEAFSVGASAILLIVAILSDDQLKRFMEVAQQFDIDCLVEVHDEKELERALNVGAQIIGINNRNLRTFEVNLKTCVELIPKIPKDKIIVAESGIKTRDDVVMLQGLGANAILVGETFLIEEDISKKVNELMEG